MAGNRVHAERGLYYNDVMDIDLDGLTARLSRLATHYDVIGQWPEKSLKHLEAAHAWKWVIPKAYGDFSGRHDQGDDRR